MNGHTASCSFERPRAVLLSASATRHCTRPPDQVSVPGGKMSCASISATTGFPSSAGARREGRPADGVEHDARRFATRDPEYLLHQVLLVGGADLSRARVPQSLAL